MSPNPLCGTWEARIDGQAVEDVGNGFVSRVTDNWATATVTSLSDCCPDGIIPLYSILELWRDGCFWFKGWLVESPVINQAAGAIQYTAYDAAWLAGCSPVAATTDLIGTPTEIFTELWAQANTYQNGILPPIIQTCDTSPQIRYPVLAGEPIGTLMADLADKWLDYSVTPQGVLVGSPRICAGGSPLILNDEAFNFEPVVSWQSSHVATSASVFYDVETPDGDVERELFVVSPGGHGIGKHVTETADTREEAEALAGALLRPEPAAHIALGSASLSADAGVDVCELTPGRDTLVSSECVGVPQPGVLTFVDVQFGQGGAETGVFVETETARGGTG